jgi:hypothetical protein
MQLNKILETAFGVFWILIKSLLRSAFTFTIVLIVILLPGKVVWLLDPPNPFVKDAIDIVERYAVIMATFGFMVFVLWDFWLSVQEMLRKK